MIKIYKSSIKNDNIICGIWKHSDVPIFISNTNRQLKIPHGNGKLYNVGMNYLNNPLNFVIIDGTFKNGMILNGKIIHNNNIIYEGNFKNNIPNGVGQLYCTFNFKNENIHGIFYGNIKNFCAHGLGNIYDRNNKFVMEILCEYGKILRKIEHFEIYDNAKLLLSLSS